MRALGLVLALFALGCVDLDRPRPWRCATTTDCTGGWVCLKDASCHDPAVGAEVSCETKADCTGGWFCGQEKKCRDPGRPGDFPCEQDSQCAQGWRCSTERRCVDVSTGAAAPAFVPLADDVLLRSPLTSPSALVRTAPAQGSSQDGGPRISWQAVLAQGATLEVADLQASPVAVGLSFRASRSRVQLSSAPTELAIAADTVLAQLDSGLVLSPGRAIDPAFTAPVARLVPLTWADANGARRGAFMVLSTSGEAAWVDTDGTVTPFGTDVVDVTATGVTTDAGTPQLVVLRRTTLGEQEVAFVTAGGGKGDTLIDLSTTDGGTHALRVATQLRYEHDALALSFLDSAGITPVHRSALVCTASGCLGAIAEGFSCPNLGALPDLGIPLQGNPVLRAACPESGADFLYEVDVNGAGALREGRLAHAAWGTSRGHVRQSPGGQLAWSESLDEEVSDVLSARPQLLGVREDTLFAVRGQSVFSAPFVHDPADGLALGLGLSLQVWGEVPARPAAFLEDEELTLLENGVALSPEADGGNYYRFVLPEPASVDGTIVRKVAGPDGGVFVVTTRGGLFAGPEDVEDISFLTSALRPAPGFPINEWALRAADAGFLEGWAVANNRLFRVTASSLTRWKSTEFPVTGEDPLSVWFSGEVAQLGTASGEVFSLPARVQVVPPLLDGVTSMVGLCGAVFATTEEAVWQVVPEADGGGAWQVLDTPDVFLPLLQRSDRRLFVSDEDGVVLELPACE